MTPPPGFMMGMMCYSDAVLSADSARKACCSKSFCVNNRPNYILCDLKSKNGDSSLWAATISFKHKVEILSLQMTQENVGFISHVSGLGSNLAASCCGDESIGPRGCFGHREPCRAGQDLQLTPALTLTTAGERNAA